MKNTLMELVTGNVAVNWQGFGKGLCFFFY